MTLAALQVTGLSGVRLRRKLFSNLSFSLQPHEGLIITGVNGSGKSTLLRLLVGLISPTQGEIIWEENYLSNLHYLSHQQGIKLGLTVKENLHLMSCLLSQSLPDDHETILSTLQLNTHLHRQALHLSAGQKRKLALAKLFLFPRKIWVLDEPLTSLDASTYDLFLTKLETHLNAGGIAIISTHQPITLTKPLKTLELLPC